MALPSLDLTRMTPAERLELIEVLWDSLDQEDLEPLPADQLAELERRAAAATTDPSGGKPWGEVLDRLRATLG